MSEAPLIEPEEPTPAELAAEAEATARPRSRRRRLAWVAGVLGGLLVFVVLPGYLGTRPAFFGRLSAFEAPQRAWATSTHAEVSCEECHVPPTAMARTSYRARMVGEFYLSFVARSRKSDVLSEPTNEACLQCHSDLRTVSPKGDLQIPHRAHVEVLKMRCVQCHSYVVHESGPGGRQVPPMSGCLKCHDGETAKDDCTACHTEKAAPQSHRGTDWLVVHASKGNDKQCPTCHKWAENWCADCHSHRPRSHGRDWRKTHGDQVAKHRNCEACHQPAFCVECHGEQPKQNLDPALKLVR